MAYENLLTYVEDDPATNLTVNTAWCYWNGQEDEDTFLTRDFGAGHFGNFEHELKNYTHANTEQGGQMSCWAVGTTKKNPNDWYSDGDDGILLKATETVAGRFYFLQQIHDGSTTTDHWGGRSDSQWYDFIITRSGTSVECEIYDGASLEDTLAVTVPSGDTYRYVFAAQGIAAATANSTGYTMNLELNEPDPVPFNQVIVVA